MVSFSALLTWTCAESCPLFQVVGYSFDKNTLVLLRVVVFFLSQICDCIYLGAVSMM